MLVIPLQAIPAQTVNFVAGNQACTINLYQKSTGLFIDLYVSGVLIIGGVICQNMNLIVRDAYLGFVGDLVFYDTNQTSLDPVSTGLGSQFVLLYYAPADL